MSDPDCCPRCGTFWSCHDEQDCANDVHRENERLRSQLEDAEQTVAAYRELLREVYEAQTAACIGNIGLGGPCGTCRWCRVRAALR